MEEDEQDFGVIGFIVIFSFISVVFLFMALLILGSFNNYALNDLYGIGNDFIASGLIPASFSDTFTSTASGLINILPYLDYVWFASFISLCISSLVFSYLRKRENYFSLFSMSVLGLIIITYVGGFFIQLTNWFRTEILLKVFPTITELTPLFSWYLDNIGIINLVLIVLCIIANFIDLDFTRFNRRKEAESLDEI